MTTAPKQTRRSNNRSVEVQVLAGQLADVREVMDSLESRLESARSEFRALLVEADALNASPSLLAEYLNLSPNTLTNHMKNALKRAESE
ncbi:hypothetical protein ACUY3M_00710 [Corynebacterium suicordis]